MAEFVPLGKLFGQYQHANVLADVPDGNDAGLARAILSPAPVVVVKLRATGYP